MIVGKWLIDPRFKNRLRARYERHDIQAGILNDRPHRVARSRFTKSGKPSPAGHTSVGGMKARRKTSATGPTIAKLSEQLRKRTGANIYTSPFKRKSSREVKKFMRALVNYFGARRATASLRRRAEDLLVEAIRAPIKRREYGSHSRAWAYVKGFQRRFFDTGQLYMAIKARIKKLPGGGKVYGPFQQ